MSIKLTPNLGPNFCYAPWTNIHINPQGGYKTCCAGTVELTNLRSASIDSVLQGSELREIKTALLNNQSHPNCAICEEKEQHSTASERTWYNDIADRRVIEIHSVDQQVIQNLDIRWNNTCNLSCAYCDMYASSIWAQLKGEPQSRTDYGDNLNSVIQHVERNRGTIRNLALLGGEPLLQKENEVLLEVIDPNVHINVITNLSVPLEKNKIFNRLVEMNNVTWDVSFETVGDRFEYVRRGASWAVMLDNMATLKRLVAGRHNVDIAGTFSIYNAINLSEIYETFTALNMPHMRLTELTHPAVLSVYSLPTALKQQIAKECESSVRFIEHESRQVQRDFLLQQAHNLKQSPDLAQDTQSLVSWHRDQEQRYWPNSELKFEKLWPEYC